MEVPDPAQYTIAFESHGGSVVAPVNVDQGTAVTRPADPTRAGFTFTGWFSAETGGTEYDTWPYTPNAGSLTLESCIFSGNTIDYRGGAIYTHTGTMTARGCTFYGNRANTEGGA
jgi:uncharacterized repeat protein (TIGR02543 family)